MNNFFKNNVNRNTTYSPYFVNRPIPENAVKVNHQHKYRKYKLIILLIVKASLRQLKGTWERIITPQQKEEAYMLKVVNYADKNLALTMYLTFDKLKKTAGSHKSS